MLFYLTQIQVCAIEGSMEIFTRKSKLFCAIFILGILSAWLIAFPLHLALQAPSYTDHLNNKKTNCLSCCTKHFDKRDDGKPTIKDSGDKPDFCSICELASQFSTNGLARILPVYFSENLSSVGKLIESIYSNNRTLAILPRAPPPLTT